MSVPAGLEDEVEPLADALTTLTRLAFGLAGMMAHALGELLRSLPYPEAGSHAVRGPPPGALQSFVAVLEAAALEVDRRVMRFSVSAGRRAAPTVRFVRELPPVKWQRDQLRAALERLEAQGQAEARESQRIADAWVDRLVQAVALAVIERIDLNEVMARVDLQSVVDRLDIEAIIARVDVQKIVAGLDLNAIVAQVDVSAIVERVDLPKVTEQVFEEVDLGQIIRESTGSISGETVDAVRYQGMNMDRSLSRIVDRVLLRSRRAGAHAAEAGDGEFGPPPS